MIRPYRHTPSARPTKIRDLPRIELSSLIAPSAALAAADTAIPPPKQERPVARAASSHCHPQSGKRRTGTFYPGCCDVSSELTAANAFPENMKAAAAIMVPKNKNTFTPRAVL